MSHEQQLLKLTPESHVDYPFIRESTEQISKLCSSINERVKDMERVTKVLNIQRQLVGKFKPIVRPQRKFIEEADMGVVAPKNIYMRSEEMSGDYHIFLFNDILIIASPLKGNQFQFERTVLLETQQVNYIPESTMIILRATSGREEIILRLSSPNVAKEWADRLAETVSQAASKVTTAGSSIDSAVWDLRQAHRK